MIINNAAKNGEDKFVTILGSTGSIGTQALEVCESLGYRVVAITANKNAKILEEQIRKFKPKLAVLTDENEALKLRQSVYDTDTLVLGGIDGQNAAATHSESNLVLASIVGLAGLAPTVEAIKAGKKIALANKETLVAGGEYIKALTKKHKVDILPVDSEHSAIFQCLQGIENRNELKRLIITASGGPFFGKNRDELKNVTVEQALKHPNWSMGGKITIDSATLMNKGLELIEAIHLFDVSPENIEIVVHRESVVHSMIELADNSVIAQLGVPDMRLPIQYAMTYPNRVMGPAPKFDILKYGNLSFFEPDTNTFKPLKICRDAIIIGGTMPAMVNSANEAAVSLFFLNKISFLGIMDIVETAFNSFKPIFNYDLSDIFEADQWARDFVLENYSKF